jgi:hypothetical protein
MATPVFLINNASTAAGAYGLSVNANSSSTPAIGGGNGGSGIGFRGLSVGGIGALGVHTGTSASTAAGLEGQSSALNGTGVKGIATNGGYAKGVYGVSNSGFGGYFSATAGGWGLFAEGSTYGVNATTASDDGIGVFGAHTSAAGTAAGVQGYSNSTAAGAVGVLGQITNTSPGENAAGVRGESKGTGDNGFGVYGSADGSGRGVFGLSAGGTGVWGSSDAANGVVGTSSSGTGVWGGSTLGYGVYGASNNYAGYFDGKVHVTGNLEVGGTLSKAAGSFKIDHPLHPGTEYLQHSFVESPDMLDIYNGNVMTDERGFATVKLPAYFQALNKDFRYQLTVIGAKPGQFVQAMVVKEIAHNRFTLETSKPNVKVSWQVTGIRHDRYANAHRIKVVVLKTGTEQGKYLHPELYRQPNAKAIDALNRPARQAPPK